jgi:hypothetical protein
MCWHWFIQMPWIVNYFKSGGGPLWKWVQVAGAFTTHRSRAPLGLLPLDVDITADFPWTRRCDGLRVMWLGQRDTVPTQHRPSWSPLIRSEHRILVSQSKEGSCEHRNEYLCSVKCWKFLECLRNCWLLKRTSIPWRYTLSSSTARDIHCYQHGKKVTTF